MSHIPSPPTDDDESLNLSSTPTPFSHLHSHGSQYSATDTSQHHNQGASHFSAPSSPYVRQAPPPIFIRGTSAHSVRHGQRSTSVSSSQATGRGFRDESVLSEGDEDAGGEDEGDDDDDDNNNNNGSRVRSRSKGAVVDEESGEGDEDLDGVEGEDDPITLKDRQSLINVQHPFGLPIWKPALYKKSRSVTRHADEALHSVPSAQAERHLLPGNIFWTFAFGWWLALTCFVVSGILYVIPRGGKRYSSLVFGLGWYLAWPFGKYVEGDLDDGDAFAEDDDNPHARPSSGGSNRNTARGASPPPITEDAFTDTARSVPLSEHSTITPGTFAAQHAPTDSWDPAETTTLLPPTGPRTPLAIKSYGTTSVPQSGSSSSTSIGTTQSTTSDILGKVCFWLAIISVIIPLMLIVCLICWALVVTIPMAKLNWALIKHLFEHPTSIRFCAAPPAVVVSSSQAEAGRNMANGDDTQQHPRFSVKHQRLAEGQLAPSGSPTSTVLLCTYRAVGLQYYKYTVGGVNILFVNLLPVVFFVIFDGFVLLKMVEEREAAGRHVPAFLAAIASQWVIFILSLLSVIPLSYFIGMAVASISAQSSIGMGAVINATFGSIIEIILYSIALTQGKGHLVEGSIVGSLLAGVLLMPGMSMCSGALRRKEQKFNAKSASVTSMMLIMAIIGALTPTMFYQTYGNVSVRLLCSLSRLMPCHVVPTNLQWMSLIAQRT